MHPLDEPCLACDCSASNATGLRPAPTHERLAPGATLARYQVSGCVGAGGMGAVYGAFHTVLRRPVALKTLSPTRAHSAASTERFFREAELLARVNHPNVVGVLDAGVEGGTPFLVMEYLEGEDLSRVLAREGRLSVEQAVDVALPLVLGLAAVHRLGIVHRDVKPENVFMALDPCGDVVVKLIDFGVSTELVEPPSFTRTSEATDTPRRSGVYLEGTPHYMAPEQVRGDCPPDPRTDQYALGVLLYQCLAGRRPFDADSFLDLAFRIHAQEYQPLSTCCPGLPQELDGAIRRAMMSDAEERFPDIEALGRALLPFASEDVRRAYERQLSGGPRRVSNLPRPSSAAPPPFAQPCAATLSGVSTVQERSSIAPAAPRRPAPRRRAQRAAFEAFLRSALITGLIMIGAVAWWWTHVQPAVAQADVLGL